MIVFTLFIVSPSELLSFAFVCVTAVLTFVPVIFIHPVRVKAYQPWLGVLTLVWGVSSAALLWPTWNVPLLHAVQMVSVFSAAALLGLGLLRTMTGAR